ncbi:MAG: NAD-dependent protein deacylase [Chloroflexi bacterium]|nr:NAD-dependent protein deacylase [Chloroflexota bacterium]
MRNEFPADFLKRIRTSQHLTVLTGAGISAESGVPTFREAQTGMWEKYRPEELATPHAFRADPEKVWKWYQWRRELIANVSPNPGHTALADLEARYQQRGATFTLVTQNVDGLHHQAGSQTVIELHGNITRTKCFQCQKPVRTWKEAKTPPPACQHCGGLLRPDVVWFGENLPPDALEASLSAAKKSDLFLSIGTSAIVQPAASLPKIALNNGATVVEINPNPTPLSDLVDYRFQVQAGKLLPALMAAL